MSLPFRSTVHEPCAHHEFQIRQDMTEFEALWGQVGIKDQQVRYLQ
jgi:hypothetical protein